MPVRLRRVSKLHIYKQKGVSRAISRARAGRTPAPTDLPTGVKPGSPPHSAYKKNKDQTAGGSGRFR